MRCKKHLSDLSSSAGVCATCLRERLLVLVAAQAQSASSAAASEDSRPPPLIFPCSVSPYISRRKSDDNSATSIHHKRFYAPPQVGLTTTAAEFGTATSFKKKHRFSLFSSLFRARSDKFNLDPGVHHRRDSCDELFTSSSSPSWFSAIFTVGRKNQQSSRTSHVEYFSQFGPRDRRSCIERGMSPAVEANPGDECYLSPPGSSQEVSPRWKRIPAEARRVKTGSKNMSKIALCLSPLVRASPNRQWSGLPADMWFASEGRPPMKPHLATASGFCGNRSKKLADFGRVNYKR
ncbi:uncharacterized protein LOC105800915 [Gossypium raimondii]|uniref:Uncharacterized protein n=1 Tax=Gossypium raimondii TaxID=29730 RepID=A0A0D2TBD6_GOSRA|nr:uncharacterized protein LOC105800915 [Gossypium raimondii]KJB40940.1 hypothetical protein B456_007G084000 [Gossypium raimondii]MBA0589506.1 hypothetical protein [Gossypium raimondii]